MKELHIVLYYVLGVGTKLKIQTIYKLSLKILNAYFACLVNFTGKVCIFLDFHTNIYILSSSINFKFAKRNCSFSFST